MKFIEYERERFFSQLIWLLPITYFLHVIEESNGFAQWVTNVIGGQISVAGFYRNNAVIMCIVLAICFLAYRKRTAASTFLFLLCPNAVMFWNFIFHMYGQYRFQTYSPGYFTATLLGFPAFCYLSYVCLRERFVQWYVWAGAFVGAAVVMSFILWAGLYHVGPIPWDKWF